MLTIVPSYFFLLLMRYVITLLFLLVALSGMAQSEEPSDTDDKRKWSAGGLLMMMAPYVDHHYYDKDNERFVPQSSMIWLGSSRVSDGIMHGSRPQFHLKDGFLDQMDGGVTLLQLSRNLYRGFAGYTIGLQFEGSTYHFSRNYIARSAGGRIGFVSAEPELEENNMVSYAARIPLLVGVQTPKRWLSLQTGLGLYVGGSEYEYRFKGRDEMHEHHFHTSHVGAQWLLTAGIGPVTVNFTQNLTSHFKLTDGTKAYPSSITIGIDLWYLSCRLTPKPSYSFAEIAQNKNIRVDSTSLERRQDDLTSELYDEELKRLLVPQNTQFGVIRTTPFRPESSLTYDSINHTLVYKAAYKSIYEAVCEATIKQKKAGTDVVLLVPRKKIHHYTPPVVLTYTLSISDEEAQEMKNKWTDAINNAGDDEDHAMDGTKWEFFIGNQRTKTYDEQDAFVKYANELMDSVFNNEEEVRKKILNSYHPKIEWVNKDSLDMIHFADTCQIKDHYNQEAYTLLYDTKELTLKDKRYYCCFQPVGSGQSIWLIHVYKQEEDRWTKVAEGEVTGPVLITADIDPGNNKIVFSTLDAKMDTYTKKIKSLKKGYEIGELPLSDL